MPWIEETIEHQNLLDELWWKVLRRFEDTDGNKWWPNMNPSTEVINLYKIAFEKGAFISDGQSYKPTKALKSAEICITRHMIMRRWDNELLGLAQSTGKIKVNVSDCPEEYEEMMDWLVSHYNNSIDYSTLYMYTLENYFGATHVVDLNGVVHPVTVMTMDLGEGVLNTSLDVEFHSEGEFHPDTNQSPIISMSLKQKVSKYLTVGKYSYKTDTNWWKDSLVRVSGFVDETSIYLTLHADTTPGWEDNRVPKIPLFFGNLVDNTGEPTNQVALFGGTQVPWDFDFDSAEDKVDPLQPTSKNYVHRPSNGVDTVMVKRSKHGARYQEHYLRWNAPTNDLPPNRFTSQWNEEKEEEEFRKYPRAWNYSRRGYTEYNYHPSKYSDSLHVSRASVIHPEDGVVGQIPNIVLTPLIGLTDGEELEMSSFCMDCSEVQNYNPDTPTSGGKIDWTVPHMPLSWIPGNDFKMCSDEIFFVADTVEEAEKFATDCLNIIPIYYHRSLEWANYVNRGIWELTLRYPSIKKILQENEVAIMLDDYPDEPNSLGYFLNPQAPEDIMVIGIISSRTIEEYEMLLRASFDAGFLATPDKFHLLTHEFGHFLHYSNVSFNRWRQLGMIDEDGYGSGTPLSSEAVSDIEESISEYATVYYPLEYVAEVFALFSLGYGVPERFMDRYVEHDGFVPEETSVEEISQNNSRPF